jgi:hypothetical protein
MEFTPGPLQPTPGYNPDLYDPAAIETMDLVITLEQRVYESWAESATVALAVADASTYATDLQMALWSLRDKHGMETPAATTELLRRHDLMLSLYAAWSVFNSNLWLGTLTDAQREELDECLAAIPEEWHTMPIYRSALFDSL